MFDFISNLFCEKEEIEITESRSSAEFIKLLEEEIIFNSVKENPKTSSTSDVEVKPTKVYQAGVDYPSLVIQDDGSHIFTWGEVVIILPLEEVTYDKVTAIMQSSFSMFQANSKVCKEKAEDPVKVDATVVADTRVEELKEAITSIENVKPIEQTAMAAAISKAMGSDTLKAAAAEDRIHEAEERKEFAFSRVKRRNR